MKTSYDKRELPGAARLASGRGVVALVLALIVIGAAWVSPVNAGEAGAGQAVFVHGDTFVRSIKGADAPLRRGDLVNAGDTVVTAAKAMVQLRMSDGTLISIRPDSQFRIEDYQYENNATRDRSFYQLIKGGFRSITGAIGKHNKKAYGVKTPVANIGIRGTDYVARYCNADCAVQDGTVSDPVADGLYLSVLSGGVVMANSTGNLNVDPGQLGYVSDAYSAPDRLLDIPSGLLSMVDDQAVVAESDSDKRKDTKGTTKGRPLVTTIAQSAHEEQPLVVTALTGVNADGTVLDFGAVNSLDSPAPIEESYSRVAFGAYGAGFNYLGVKSISDVELDATGQLVSFQAEYTNSGSSGSATFTLGSATNTDFGYDANTGIAWGRWAGGTVTVTKSDGSVVNENLGSDSLHWVMATDNSKVFLPTTGSATYNWVGGTTPTQSGGSGWSVNSSSNISADFGLGTVQSNLTLTDGSTTLSTAVTNSSTGNINVANGTFTIHEQVVVDQFDIQYSTGSGTVNGVFVGNVDGAAPKGVAVSYQLTDGTSNPVTGSGALAR